MPTPAASRSRSSASADSAVTTLLAFLFTLAVLIVFHEFGHYLVARLAGVKVLRFSVGFGKVLTRRTDRHGTEWALSAIPLGGYVKMLDEREGEVAEAELPRAFNRQSLAKRSAIVAAGPLANLLLAVLLLWGLNLSGVPVLQAIVAEPPAQSPAALAGMQAGESVQSLNGEAVEGWQDLHLLVLKHGLRGGELALETTDADGRRRLRHLQVPAGESENLEQAPLKSLGLAVQPPPMAPVIGTLSEGGVAQRAGLQSGDRILAIDGHPVGDWSELVTRVRAAPGQPLQLSLQRADQQLQLSLTPEADQQDGQRIGRIGAAPKIDEAALAARHRIVRYGPVEAFGRALARTWELSAFSVEMMGRMLMGQVSVKNLSGPITIADYAGQSAHAGADSFIAFLALISISLGVLNLLPVPLLDGGHLLYYLAELLTGRPLPERIQDYGQRVGMVLLGLLMFLALFNDLQRLFAG
jgi:regulator of sigma E protease